MTVPRILLTASLMVVALTACGGGTSQAALQPAPKAASVARTTATLDVPAGPCHYEGPNPDRVCTPGETAAVVTPENLSSTICHSGYADNQRPLVSYTESVKYRLLASYGDVAPAAAYELDHLVPLELGGAPRSPRNLWPEPWENDTLHPQGFAPPGTGAQTKDKLENELHHRVCAPITDPSHMDLTAAQAAIATDWHGEAVFLHLAT
jgi:hypothetical protein